MVVRKQLTISMHTILVVEDEADIADLVAFNLRRNEFEVELAYDGIQGLAKAKELKPVPKSSRANSHPISFNW